MRRGVTWALAGALMLMTAGVAQGQSCTASTTATAFGVYEPFNALPTDTVGAVNVRCNAPLVALLVSFSISLTPGSGGSFAGRSMASGTNRLNISSTGICCAPRSGATAPAAALPSRIPSC